ncbi:MAG: hybrid sensor histidine kinase/response regulator [Planctomycetota bacterium]|jgi:PAS domain S-box-containing protein
MIAAPARILIIEDEPDTRSNLLDILEMFGFAPSGVGSAEAALTRDDLTSFDVILLDRRLPDVLAEELLPRLRKVAPEASFIIATAYGDLDGTIGALRHGAADYLIKPINPDALRASIDRCLDHKRLERARRQSEAAFRNLVESAGSIILIIRPDRTVAYINPYGEHMTGRTLETVGRQDCIQTFLGHQDTRPYETLFRRIMKGASVPEFELEVVCEHDRHHWLVCNARRLDDYEGEPAVLVIGQDITARRHAEQRLLQAERLAAIGKAMTGLAHESRNALQRSQASLDMLAADFADNAQAMKLIERIQTAQDDLHRLYEDVREYARPLQVNPLPASLDELLRHAWDELIVKREGRVTSLEITCETEQTRCPVEAFLIRQVFRNILDNSLAACEDPVEITATLTDGTINDRQALCISIRDNGPGLPADCSTKVFDEFFTTKTHGTGLGLAIVKRLIDVHRGTIALDRNVQSGFALRICIPREAPRTSN